jgi:hypothetical protein
MTILDTIKDFFSTSPKEPEAKEVETSQEKKPQEHHHNHGSSTT